MFYTYILHNQTIDKYYIGSSLNIEKRLLDHNKLGHKTKFTRKQIGLWVLVHKAVIREKYIEELIKMVE